MWAFVPSAGAVLAHWGADVIKVENPRSPDPVRYLPGTAVGDGDSWFFKHYSRGKRGLGIDLSSDEGRDILYRLVEQSDVFLTSFLTPTRKKLRFDIDDIRAVNPNIIYAKGTGQGPRGPDAERGGYDGATWWCRGSLAQTTMTLTGIDWPSGMIGHGDGISGLTLAGGACAALVKRQLTGKPSVVDCSLLGTAIWLNGPSIVCSGLGSDFMEANGTAPREARHPTNQSFYRTKDGRFIMLSMLGDSDDEWIDLCEHLGRADLGNDSRFATSADRVLNRATAIAIFDEIFAQRSLEEWKTALATTKGVWSPVQSSIEMFDDPQTIANGFLKPVEDADGVVRVPSPPILFDEDPGDPAPAPRVGEHTDEILAELGLSAATIQELRELGKIG